MERELKARHWYKGLLLPLVILPPKGRPDYLSGNFENCPIWTGLHLAGQVWRWKLTADPVAKASADECLDGLLFLETVTGHPGYLARGFKEAQGPSWDEDLFWNKSWYQAGEYRWMGQVTKDQACGRLFGFCCYHDLVPDEDRKALIRESVRRVFSQIVSDNMKIIDIGDGSYRKLYAEHSGQIEFAVMALFAMQAAYHLTGDDLFRRKYLDLVDQGYLRIAIEGSARKGNHGPGYAGMHHSDTHLVFMGLYHLFRYETDEKIRSHYLRSLERNFGAIQTERNAFHNFVYHSVLEDCGDDEGALQSLREMPIERLIRPVKNSHRTDFDRTYPLPVYERPASEYEWASNAYRLDGRGDADGTWEHSTADFLAAYWMGRYHGFISPDD
jgi:hypothetical protein